MTEPEHSSSAHAELQRQDLFPWRRDRFFRTYEQVLGHYLVRSVLEHKRGDALLDVGCGNGLLTSLMAAHFQIAVGLDASAECVAEAAGAHPDITFVHALAEQYESDRRFGTITMITLLEHVPDPVETLRAVATHLAPDGVLIVHVPNALAANRRLAALMGTLTNEYELSPFDLDVAGHRRYYDMPKLLADCQAAALNLIYSGGVFYKSLSQAQFDWLLEHGPWEAGGFGWGRVGEETARDWRSAFCDACYEYGKTRPEDCNVIFAVVTR